MGRTTMSRPSLTEVLPHGTTPTKSPSPSTTTPPTPSPCGGLTTMESSNGMLISALESPTIRAPSTLTHGCSTLATTTDTALTRPSPSATPPMMSPLSSETRPTETSKSSSETQTRCGLNLNHLFLQFLDKFYKF